MNKTKLLGLSITAVFTALLLSGATSAYAGILGSQCGSLWDIDHATVFENPNEVSVLTQLVNCNNILQDDLFGSGALTDGTHVVGASHGGPNGFLDSEAQMGDPTNPVPHNHLINLAPAVDTNNPNDCLSQNLNHLVVQSLSFESPGVTMFGGTINTGEEDDLQKIWEVPKVLDGTDALTMNPQVFTLGNLGANPTVVTFHLSLGAPGEVCVLVKDSVEASLEDLARKVGGEFLPIDSTALLIAGMSANMGFIVPIAAGIVGAGAYLIRSRLNKD